MNGNAADSPRRLFFEVLPGETARVLHPSENVFGLEYTKDNHTKLAKDPEEVLNGCLKRSVDIEQHIREIIRSSRDKLTRSQIQLALSRKAIQISASAVKDALRKLERTHQITADRSQRPYRYSTSD